jgi:hypothetical protein
MLPTLSPLLPRYTNAPPTLVKSAEILVASYSYSDTLDCCSWVQVSIPLFNTAFLPRTVQSALLVQGIPQCLPSDIVPPSLPCTLSSHTFARDGSLQKKKYQLMLINATRLTTCISSWHNIFPWAALNLKASLTHKCHLRHGKILPNADSRPAVKGHKLPRFGCPMFPSLGTKDCWVGECFRYWRI